MYVQEKLNYQLQTTSSLCYSHQELTCMSLHVALYLSISGSSPNPSKHLSSSIEVVKEECKTYQIGDDLRVTGYIYMYVCVHVHM